MLVFVSEHGLWVLRWPQEELLAPSSEFPCAFEVTLLPFAANAQPCLNAVAPDGQLRVLFTSQRSAA